MRYLVCYDLRNERDYQRLYDELRKLKARHIQESVWTISIMGDGYACKKLRDRLAKFIDEDDSLFVVSMNGLECWSGCNLLNSPHKFLIKKA